MISLMRSMKTLNLVIGDTLPVLLALYFPQYPALSDRTSVLLFVSVFLVS